MKRYIASLLIIFAVLATHEAVPLDTTQLQQDGDVPLSCVWYQVAVHVVEEDLNKVVVSHNITSEGQLENVAIGMCDKYLKNETLCTKIVKPIIMAYWTGKSLPPKTACALAHQCPMSYEDNSVKELTMIKSVVLSTIEDNQNNGTICEMCHSLVELVTKILVNEELVIEKFIINQFCAELPAAPRKQCEVAVPEDVPKLLNGLTPEFVCNMTTFC